MELEEIIKYEVAQRREEGYDFTKIEDRMLKTEKLSFSELRVLLKDLEKLPIREDYPYKELSDLREISMERLKEPERIKVDLSDDELYDRIYGGWLGRCAGCLLGKPVEGLKKEQIQEWLKMADAYPLRNYFPAIPNPPKPLKEGTLLGEINRMVRDDDIDYTIMNLHILETHGSNFTTMNVGESWLSMLPYLRVFTAERAAYRNLVNGILPPESATHMNPYREWIGAQIRADMWGYITPGMPNLGVEFAYRDARLSHTKNGIYGEMFVSAMISMAFTTENINRIIEAGLSAIPKNSRLAEAIRDVVTWSKESSDWEDTWNKVMEKYGHYHRTHTINNAALVLLGLIHGRGDYERSITISVMSGLDTDCNGATVGSILGIMLGAKSLPDKWIKPLNDRVESFVTGYDNSRISKLAKHTLKLAKKNLKRK
ncbi:MAG: ADP-ribosylglycohydrolase family protein [Candidatus Bathyarchaeia archaeon]